MKTYTQLTNLATSLSQNTSTANQTLMGQLVSDQHRYLLQKYFDNERTFQTSTVGSQSLTLTGAPAIGATSATLTSVWAYPSCIQQVNFSDGEQRSVTFTYNSATISWSVGLTNAVTTAISSVGIQAYIFGAQISKLTDVTINVGQQKFTPVPIQTRQEWDRVNFLPYNSDIPAYFYIYQGQLNLFPIPATTGYVITFNYKTKVPDLSFTDYIMGNITGFTAGSTDVIGSGTSWTTGLGVPTSTDILYFNLGMRTTPPKGDGLWNLIQSVNSDTDLTLYNPAVHTATSGASYTIGQIPLLKEDFHDMLVYGALKIYFSSIVEDQAKYKQFEAEYNSRLVLLEDYAGTKNVNVDLGDVPRQVNANLYLYVNTP